MFTKKEFQMLQTPAGAYWHAQYVLNAPWPEAEAVIMTNAHYAFCYAQSVLKRRWLDAEDTIRKDPYSWELYTDWLVLGDIC